MYKRLSMAVSMVNVFRMQGCQNALEQEMTAGVIEISDEEDSVAVLRDVSSEYDIRARIPKLVGKSEMLSE